MCGIAGILENSLLVEQTADDLCRKVSLMVDALNHRGPDERSVWVEKEGKLCLGHARLSIIDLSAEGRQPMVSACGRYVISYNGEVYNYIELKKELRKLGTTFRGTSDTEVMLAAISRWGFEKALNKFVGIFAFALWDKIEKKLILVKDRVGKKPLYYSKRDASVYFASEIKAFRTLEDIDFALDYDSLYQYLTFGYIPSPKTIYKKIMEVPPGFYVIINKDFNLESRPYWDISWNYKKDVTFDEAVNEIDTLLKEAVIMRLRADVPVGCFLSGGIDSGLITAIASKQLDHPLKTLTIAFDDATFDESSLAELVAKRYRTDHQVIKLFPNLDDVLPQVVKAYDEPFADPSAVPSYCVSREARRHVKVILTGDGGDEILGGYRRHLAIKTLAKYNGFFKLMPDIFWNKISEILPAPKTFRSYYAFSHRFLRGINNDPFDRYISWCVDGFNDKEKRELCKKFWKDGRKDSTKLLYDKFNSLDDLNPLDHFMAMDFLLNLPDCLLVKMDIATMAHGLEARSPFLDHRIIEWASTLPPKAKMKGFKTKPILRALAKRYLPEAVVNAPKKGFEIPLIKWLRQDLFDMVHDFCLRSNGIVLDLFNKKYVEDLLSEKHRLDPDRWSKRVWILFILAMWRDQNK